MRRWGLVLSPQAVERVEAEAQKRPASPSAVLASVIDAWAGAGAGTASAPPPEPEAARPETLEEFASRVRAAVSHVERRYTSPDARGGWYVGDRRVFIAYVWRQLEAERPASAPIMTLDEFKRRLLEANRARLVTLARADLVEAMNHADVMESETRYLVATFHFIVVGA